MMMDLPAWQKKSFKNRKLSWRECKVRDVSLQFGNTSTGGNIFIIAIF